MKTTRTKRLYDYRAFNGIDASLDISLFEYGLIWKRIGKDYKFIYGVGFDKDCAEVNYNQFDYAFLPIDVDILDEYSWADFTGVLSFVGMSMDEWLKMPLPQKIFDLISYYGYEEIFGSNYGGFNISGNEEL